MKSSNQWLLKSFSIAAACVALCNSASAQQADITYLTAAEPAKWVALEPGEKPDSANVWIRAGHTITLDQDVAFKGILIDQNAVLNSDKDARTESRNKLVSLVTNSGILNNGTLGSTTGTKDGIDLLVSPSAKTFYLIGSGKNTIASLRPEKANNGLTINISQDLSLNGNHVAFSAIPVIGNTAATDNVTVNVDAGKTVKLTSPNGELNGSVSGPGGKYTYNVKGTIDLSATNTLQNLAPFSSTAASLITVNISGLVKFGPSLNFATPAGSQAGKVALNVLNGGVADATATTALNFGFNYFATTGTGVLKRRVNNTDIIFPVGGGSIGPIALKSTAAPADIAVSVKNQLDVPAPNSSKVINKQWTVSSTNGAGVSLVMRTVWGKPDASAGFNPAAPISVIWRNPGQNTWNEKAATLSGNGTFASPYIALATGLTNFGVFAVQNSTIAASTAAVSLYPNPTARIVNVTFPEATQDGTLSVTSHTGRQMLKTDVRKGATNWTYDVAAWDQGVYILHMETAGKVSAIKFIKQ